MRIKYKSVMHYLLIYLMLACGGTAWSSFIGNNQFVLLSFFLPLTIIILKNNIKKDYLYMFSCYTVFCVLAMTYSSLSIGTYMNIGGKLLLVYVVLSYDKEHFIERFMKLSFVLCSVSLGIFIVTQVIGFQSLAPLYTQLYTNPGDGSYELGNGYGVLLYRFVPLHSGKNCGMFTEPGEHAIYLNVLLYMTLVHTDSKSFPWRNKMLIITLLNIITCQSTSGYAMMACILILTVVSEKIKIGFNKKWWLLIIVAIIFSYDYLQDLFKLVVTNKIFFNGMIDLNQGTASARYSSIVSVFKYIFQNWTAIFGIGFDKLQADGVGSCAGLLATLLTVGIFAFASIYVFMLKISFKYRRNYSDFLMQLSIILISGFSQPGTAFPVVFMINLYLYLCSDYSIKIS